MIFHTINTMTIGRFADMQSENDHKYLLRFKMYAPKRILKKKYRAIVAEFNKINSKKEVSKLIAKDIHRLKMLNTINIQYSIMLKLLDVVAKYGNEETKSILDDIYNDRYGKYPKTQDDYMRIRKDNNLLIRKINQQSSIEGDKKEPMSFEEILQDIELILAPMQIRERKLYNFGMYVSQASKKISNARN